MKPRDLSILEKAYLSLLIILTVHQLVKANKKDSAFLWHHLAHQSWKLSRRLMKLSTYAEREYWKVVNG